MEGSIYIKKGHEGIYEEKKSRFIAVSYPVANESEVSDYINIARKKYYDARHNCFAYVIGKNNEFIKCSDDGEPQGTAGKPILDVINNHELHNCLIIVSRYFGGTLLGTGGLIRAYTKASQLALDSSELSRHIDGSRFLIETDYNSVSKIMRAAAENSVTLADAEYGEKVKVFALINKNKSTEFCTLMNELTNGKAIITFKQDEIIEEPF